MANVPGKSCLKCSRFVTCTDTRRMTQRGHFCDSFVRVKAVDSMAELDDVELIPRGETDPYDRRSGKHADSAAVVSEPDDDVPDNFFRQAMERAYDPHTNTVRDMRVDDSDLPLAANYYDYCANLSGPKIRMPFARQLWICLMLMGEVCPKCTHSKATDMFNVPVDLDPHKLARSMTLLEHGICPNCGATKYELLRSGLLRDYYELVFVGGQRAGKSTIAATIATYMYHRYAKAPKLASLADGIQDFTPLTFSCVALTATKANKLVWQPIRDMISASVWWQDYFDLLDDVKRETGKELYQFKPSGTYLRLFHKGLEVYPEGPSKRTLRGATRIGAATDELGHFPFDPRASETEELEDDERERANADEVHTVLGNSLATVRTSVAALYKRRIFVYPQAMNLSLSSPASHKDKIMRLLRESKSSKVMLGIQAATWEISPMYTRNHPLIVDMYARNPRKAERDFGANPPALSSSVFDRDAIAPAFVLRSLGQLVYDADVDATAGHLRELHEPNVFQPAILSLDAGVVDNAFALTLTTRNGDVLETPLVLEIVPQVNRPINFARVYARLIKPMISAYNVCCVVADRWNSIFVLDQIREDFPRVRTQQITLNAQDCANFKLAMLSQLVRLPQLELEPDQIDKVTDYKIGFVGAAASHLFSQMQTIQEVGGMYYKGEGATDDLLRALMVGNAAFSNKAIADFMRTCRPKTRDVASQQANVLVGSRIAFGQQAVTNQAALLVGRRCF